MLRTISKEKLLLKMQIVLLYSVIFSCLALLDALPASLKSGKESKHPRNGLIGANNTPFFVNSHQKAALYHNYIRYRGVKQLSSGKSVKKDGDYDSLVLDRDNDKRSIMDEDIDSESLLYTFEGDIIAPVKEIEKKFEMSERDKQQLEASADSNGYHVNKQDVHFKEGAKWKDNTVPYYISVAFTEKDKQTILRAMYRWGNATCLKFVRRSTEIDYIFFNKHEKYCDSFIGRQGGPQTINVPDWCLRQESGVEHEIGHALGLWHEQSRPDRDSYITINVTNIKANFSYNFDRQKDKYIDFQGSDYDYASIMHYPLTAFHKKNCKGQNCITMNINNHRAYDEQGEPDVGHQAQLSQRDARQIHHLYNCPGKGRTGSLWIYVKQGYNLTDLETGGTHDPFLKISAVSSDGAEHFKNSSYKHNTRYPTWNEWVSFPKGDWQLLRLRLWDHRTNSPMTMSETVPLLEHLSECSYCLHCANVACNVLVTYYFEIVIERMLTVYIRYGRTLSSTDQLHHSSIGSFVVVRAYDLTGTPHMLQTTVKLNQLNPVWNQYLRYKVGPWKYFEVTAYNIYYFKVFPLSSTVSIGLPSHTTTARNIYLHLYTGGYILLSVVSV